jgi:PAS domain S-box-containing protein
MKPLTFRAESEPFCEGLFAQAYLNSMACSFALSALSNANLEVVFSEAIDAASLAVDAVSVQIIEFTSDGAETIRLQSQAAPSSEGGELKTLLDFPIPGRTGPIGILRLRLSTGAPTSLEEEFLTSVASVLGHAMQRSKDESQLRLEEERFRGLVDAEQDRSLIALDCEGRIVTWNKGAARLWGYVAADVMGRHIDCLYSPGGLDAPGISAKDRKLTSPDLALAQRSGGTEVTGWLPNARGTPFLATVVVSPTRNAQGKLTGFAHLTTPAVQPAKPEDLGPSRAKDPRSLIQHPRAGNVASKRTRVTSPR